MEGGTGSFLSGAFQAGATLGVGLLNHDENKRMRKIAQKQLDLAREQYQWEKNKYNTTLKNQNEALNTLGDSFKKALNNESTSTPSLGAFSMAATKPLNTPQEPLNTQSQSQLLPTERM